MDSTYYICGVSSDIWGTVSVWHLVICEFCFQRSDLACRVRAIETLFLSVLDCMRT